MTEPSTRSLSARIATAIGSLGMLGPFAVFTILAPAAGALILATTTADWLPVLERYGAIGLILCTILLAGLSLIPTHAVSLVSGYLFGAPLGTLIAVFAISGAAVLGYFVSALLVGDRLWVAATTRPRAAAVHRALLASGTWRTVALIALVRLSPVMPFACTNLLLAASRVRFAEFILGSMVGLTPRIAAVAIAGAALGALDLSAGSTGIVLPAAGVLATILLLWVIGRLARMALRKLEADGSTV